MRKNSGYHQKKKKFVSSGIVTCEEAFQDPSKSCVSSGGGLEGSNKEKIGRQQKQELV